MIGSAHKIAILAFATWFFHMPGVQAADVSEQVLSQDVEVSGYYERALRQFAEGNYREAVIQSKNALKLDTGHLPSRVLLGKAYANTGNPGKAELEFMDALEMGGDPLMIDIPLGEALFQMGKHNALITRIHPRGQPPVGAAQILVLRGRAYTSLGQKDLAEAAFVQAQRLDPGNEAALIGQALSYLQRGWLDKASQYLDQAVAMNPDVAEAWFLKGQVAYQNGLLDEGVTNLTRALEVDPGYSQARMARAAYLADLNRLQLAQQDLDLLHAQPVVEPMASYIQAIVFFRKGESGKAEASLASASDTIARIPSHFLEKNPQVLLLAGQIAFIQGKQELAAKSLETYLRLDPGHPRARQMMTHILLRRGKPLDARKMLEPLMMRMPNDPMIQLLMGQAYLAMKEYEAASELFERLIVSQPDNFELQIRLARSLVGARQIQEAIELLERIQQVDESPTTGAGLMLAVLYLDQKDYGRVAAALAPVLDQEPSNPLALNLLGLGRLGDGDLAGAEVAFSAAVQVDSRFLPARLNLGRVLIRRGQPQQARNLYLELLKSNPGQMDALTALSELEVSLGNQDMAIRWREKLRVFHPEEIDSSLKLVGLYLNGQRPRMALEVARSLHHRHPNEYRVQLVLGLAEMASGQHDAARSIFQNLARNFSHDANKLYQIADYQKQLNDLEAAHWSLSRSVENAPKWVAAIVDLVLLEIRTGKMDSALGRALKLQVMLPNGSEGHFLEGELYLAEGNGPMAEKAYLRAWGIRPDSVTAIRLYQVRRMSGQQELAVESLQTWGAEHPDDFAVQKILGGEMIYAGRITDARAIYERLIISHPNTPDVLNNLAMLYQMTDDKRALEMARKAYELSPQDPLIADTLGWVLVKEGRAEDGLIYLREAQSRMSNLPDIGYHLAEALHALGRDKEARTVLERILNSGEVFADKAEAEALLKRIHQ
ncbi:MAG: PEP-CTERM system TPR-repeat protein PrsT [Gammaproteobacteria bacterium]|nr:PEP-CTERM system TPR-repeat protein PrsT [Gammaproteobacteria bacterium]